MSAAGNGKSNAYPEPLGLGSGLTKREMLAAMAMQGLLASEVTATHEEFAASAVEQADALLAELEKQP